MIAKVEIWRGHFAVCGFYDDTFALLAFVGAQTGKFHRRRKIYKIFDGNFPLLSLNLGDGN